MKNNYCDLTQEDIHRLPERFKGFLLSPFQHNFSGGFVSVPEDAFKEMIAIIAECASLPPTVEPAQADAPAAPLPEQTGPSTILAKTAHMDDFNQSSVPSYAQFLTWAIWRDNYKEISPDFEIMADTWGVLSQIDNMVCGMALKPAASPSPAPAKQQEPSGFKLAGFFRKNGKLFERLKGRPNEHTLSSGWNAHYIATSERDQIADWDVRESVETSAPGASTEDKQ